MPIPTPPFIPQPFANNAGAGFKNTIPNTTVTPGLASYDAGFPPETMTPEASGGVPPFGQDVNGVLNALSAHIFAQQAGQLYKFSSSVASAIGGYPIGTLLESTDGATVWFNILAANSNDPDASGAGWVPMFTYGYTTKAVTGGTVTLSRVEARSPVIVLTGTLVSNLIVILPNTFQTWLIVNSTTGSFSTTVKTAVGTGVSVVQGGFPAPTGVYGDGTNINLTVSPASLPIDQAPTPLTIAQRNNLGYLFATYFNQNSALENPTMGAVFVESNAADGFFRKISIANFQIQLNLANFGGAVANSQVPLSAIAQYVSLNPANPGSGNIAGKIQLRFGSFFVGDVPTGFNQTPLVFDTPFPTACLHVIPVIEDTNQANVVTSYTNATTSGFTFNYNETAARVQNATLHYLAIGY